MTAGVGGRNRAEIDALFDGQLAGFTIGWRVLEMITRIGVECKVLRSRQNHEHIGGVLASHGEGPIAC